MVTSLSRCKGEAYPNGKVTQLCGKLAKFTGYGVRVPGLKFKVPGCRFRGVIWVIKVIKVWKLGCDSSY